MLKLYLSLPVYMLITGCGIFDGTANNFESNSAVGYVPPIEDTTTYSLREGGNGISIQNPNISYPSGDEVINKGECIAIDMIGGYINQTFEPMHERKLFGSRARSEVTVAIATYERRDSTTINQNPEEIFPSNAEYNIFSTSGQLSERPLAVENVPIYGPRRYEGGDLFFHISMVEQDKEELEALKSDITTQIMEISQRLPEDTQSLDVHSALSKAMADATFTLSGTGMVAVGLNAVELFISAYKEIHSDDDQIIQHSFSLTSGNRSPNIHQPVLRIGYYPIARLSTKEDYPEGFNGANFDPIAPRLTMGEPLDDPIWVAFRVSKFDTCL
ncbi:hypothetical protein [Halomonas sp. N3-2A]|uniref:hypothetical protein n=1 Tax=Halomonas sp. N3-2A TaxID=2014541 RepID=UPI000B5B34E1|nr:hypothetical protein [Halomonas sp. N3-2A]ASK19250.1 hypothetical protein CEK60_08000 [Halomonas sp. N3-2A]